MTARLPTTPEDRRLQSLTDLMVLDSAPEPLFDGFARTAAEVCAVPIAMLTLIDETRQWFKASVGVGDVTGTPREVSFCTHTIRDDAMLEVRDARLDPRFAANWPVCGEPGVRFYAGAPLVMDDGERVGTLCVMHREPCTLTATQAAMLRSLASLAAQALIMRRDLLARALSARSAYERSIARSEAIHRAMVEHQKDLVSLSSREGELLYVNPAYAAHFGRSSEALIGSNLFKGVEATDLVEATRQIDEVFESGVSRKRDFRTLDANGVERWVSWMHSLQPDVDGTPLLHSVGRDVTDRKRLELALAERELFLRQITDNLPAQVAYVDTQRRYRFANLPHVRRMGVPRESLLGRTRSEITGGVDDADVEPRLDAALAGTPQRFEFEVEHAGQRLRMQTQLLPDFAPDGSVQGVFAIALDITARSASERSVRELLAIFDNTPDFVVQSNAKGVLTYMNPAARRAAGIARNQSIDDIHYARFVGGATRHVHDAILPAARRDGVWVGESVLQPRAGVEMPVSHMVITHRDAHGHIDRYSTVMRDISDEMRAKHEQLRHAATLRSVAEAIPAAVGVVDVDRRYRFVNQAYAAWCGMPGQQIVGRTMEAVLGPSLHEVIQPHIDAALAGHRVQFDREPSLRQPGRHVTVTYIPLWLDHTVDGFVSIHHDVTEQRLEESRLRSLSQRDVLTGLLNRAGFESYLEQVTHAKDANLDQLAAFYIDLDRFKPVNDSYGHSVGDDLLRAFSRRLSQLFRPTDAVVRLGGDEFVVVLTGVRDASAMESVADKIVEMAHTPFDLDGLRIEISASVGMALGIDRHGGWTELLERADATLYQAKAAGRDQRCGEVRPRLQ